jgi:arginase
MALVVGGDCTVGIGTIAGVQAAIGDIAVAYFDLYSDLNTPAAANGALDWMALGHMLGVEGCEPALAETTGHGPLLEPSQVVLVAHSLSHSTRLSGVRSNDYGWPGLPGRMSGGIPKMARGERSS